MSGVCYSYKDTGNCRFGDSCRFSHDGGAGGGGGDDDFQTVSRNRREQRGGSSAGGRYNDSGSSYQRRGGDGDYGSYGGRSYGSQREPQPCHSWTDNGSCEYGERCRFTHGSEPTRGSGASTGGSRGGFGGNSRYGARPAGPCYEYQEKGSCQYGDRCRFSHGEDDSRGGNSGGGRSERSGGGGGSAPCYSFQSSGSCRFGDSCRFSHNSDSNDKKISNVDTTATESRTGSDGQPQNPQSDPTTTPATTKPQAEKIKSPQAGAIKSPSGPTASA